MSKSIHSGTGDDAQVKGCGVKAKAQLRFQEKDHREEERAEGESAEVG